MFRDSFYESKILDSLVFPILDSSEIGFSIFSSEGKILEVNDAFCELFGYNREEIIHQDFTSIVMEENLEYSRKNHNDFMENGFFDKREVLLRHKEGRFFFVQLIDMKFNDESGNVYRATTYTNITEKKQNELIDSVLVKIPQIAESSESLETVFRNIHASVEQLMPAFNFYIALYDDETDILSYPYFSKESDCEKSQMMSKESYDLITNYILKNGKSVLLNDRRLENIISRQSSSSPRIKPEAVLGAVLRIKGIPCGAITIMDFNERNAFSKCHLTTIEKIAEQLSHLLERKKYEEQLTISRERAEEANRIKSAFLTQMSHEIRTPINTIISFAWLLKEKFGDKTDNDVMDFFSIIEGGAKRLVRTIDLILNMSQLQNETIEVRPCEFDLEEKVLKPILKDAKKMASVKNVEVSYINKAYCSKMVGDENTINQIFEQNVEQIYKTNIAKKVRNERGNCLKHYLIHMKNY